MELVTSVVTLTDVGNPDVGGEVTEVRGAGTDVEDTETDSEVMLIEDEVMLIEDEVALTEDALLLIMFNSKSPIVQAAKQCLKAHCKYKDET